ncbi:hypothetical protein VFPPC_16993 [Pochonia chlamydosporia 170]|uniref:Uncharacterized protein n=1 Tax=Pochonia chlamydosporia 170 TaxID=1380566 RepID=A0A179EZH0_METCM|nr:hypothetical protein VFPPC_16993 [Pochonia chlamydosporia 170]OAQ58299.1 hypothetical protein VFPPC_16993 [Pochonia chlamydosporia 170]
MSAAANDLQPMRHSQVAPNTIQPSRSRPNVTCSNLVRCCVTSMSFRPDLPKCASWFKSCCHRPDSASIHLDKLNAIGTNVSLRHSLSRAPARG